MISDKLVRKICEWDRFAFPGLVQLRLYLAYRTDKFGNFETELTQTALDLGVTANELVRNLDVLKRDKIIKYTLTLDKLIVHYKQARSADVDLSFCQSGYDEPMTDWLLYKRERKQSYNSEISIKKCYNKLLELSEGDAKTAQAIVDQSIANNWSGLFPLRNERTNKTNQRSVADFAQAATMLLQQSTVQKG